MSGMPDIRAAGKGPDGTARGGSNLEGRTRNIVGMVVGPVAGFFGGLASVNRFKVSAILVWLIGVYTTSLVANSVNGGNHTVDSVISGVTVGWYSNALIGAFIIQYLITTFEAPIFNKQGFNWISGTALALDIAINAVVTYPISEGIVYGPVWEVLNRTIQNITGASLDNQELIITLLAILLGLCIAAGPEFLWSQGSRRRG